MSEEILSEFTEELIKRNESYPRDLVEKYRKLGLSDSEMATALLARSALKNPGVPPSAFQKSEQRVAEQAQKASQQKGTASPKSGLKKTFQKFLRKDGQK